MNFIKFISPSEKKADVMKIMKRSASLVWIWRAVVKISSFWRESEIGYENKLQIIPRKYHPSGYDHGTNNI